MISPPVSQPDSNSKFRFGDFELDIAAYELRRGGQPIHLERHPMDLLILLVERRRQLVSRADIVKRLWDSSVFVDVETGVNTAIRKLRQALRDSRESRRHSLKQFRARVTVSSLRSIRCSRSATRRRSSR